MRFVSRSIIPATGLVFLAACGGGGGDGSSSTGPTATPAGPTPTPGTSAATVAAGANSNDFSPASVTVTRGAAVTWTFGARPHNVVFGATAGAPADIEVLSNTQATRTFATAGTFAYDCTLHAGMKGTVVVQ